MIIHRTRHYRGDHEADVGIAIHHHAGETLEQLVERLNLQTCDWIELRVAGETRERKFP